MYFSGKCGINTLGRSFLCIFFSALGCHHTHGQLASRDLWLGSQSVGVALRFLEFFSTWKQLKQFLEFLIFLYAPVHRTAGMRWLLRHRIWLLGPCVSEGSCRIRILGVTGGTAMYTALQYFRSPNPRLLSLPVEYGNTWAHFQLPSCTIPAPLLAAKPVPETG